MADQDGNAALVAHLDAGARKQLDASLRASDRPFSDMMNNIPLPSVMLDLQGRVTYCNDHLLRLTGWQREEMIGRDWFAFVIWSDSNDVRENFAAALASPVKLWHRENEILTRSGERRRMRWNNAVLHSADGAVVGTASIGEDITDQKRGERRIKQLNRVYAVLSGINALIVRVRDRDELFREACRIALEQGEFRMALLCLVDQGARTIVLTTSAGIDEELQGAIRDMFRLAEAAPDNVIAQSIREKKVVAVNDLQSDPRVLFRKHYTRFGVRSLAILPLIVSNEAVGALALYARESEFFQEEEIGLLRDLIGNVSFALDSIEKEKKLNYLSYYDVLTGLANRSLFLERFELFKRRAVAAGHKLAVFLIDLERFKNINESLGRPAGDQLLKQVATWLTSRVGDATLLARVGADIFAVVLPEVSQEGDVTSLLERTVEALGQQDFRLEEIDCRIGAKVGVAVLPDDGADVGSLLENAEAALKRAKVRGDRYLFYTEKMTEMVAGRLALENQLRQALDREEFVLHYQPKVSMATGKLTGAEALIRWNDPRTGLVPPAKFIPILEETGLIFDVGRWALHQAITDYLRWRNAGLAAVRIAVNVSPLQLRHRGFIAEIEGAICVDAHAAVGLELEITESLIMEDVKLSIASLQAIRDMGVNIAIDDFGTGFSSLSYLHKLPVDALKIDRSFVDGMTVTPEALALVSTIINLARWLRIKVVAEGVETEEQQRLLRLLSCDEMQGYIFSKPMPALIFEKKYLTPAPTD
jgi:diguanylate cyclase (GGDEF)-like protein/PAS domain S-box-containing protein